MTAELPKADDIVAGTAADLPAALTIRDMALLKPVCGRLREIYADCSSKNGSKPHSVKVPIPGTDRGDGEPKTKRVFSDEIQPYYIAADRVMLWMLKNLDKDLLCFVLRKAVIRKIPVLPVTFGDETITKWRKFLDETTEIEARKNAEMEAERKLRRPKLCELSKPDDIILGIGDDLPGKLAADSAKEITEAVCDRLLEIFKTCIEKRGDKPSGIRIPPKPPWRPREPGILERWLQKWRGQDGEQPEPQWVTVPEMQPYYSALDFAVQWAVRNFEREAACDFVEAMTKKRKMEFQPNLFRNGTCNRLFDYVDDVPGNSTNEDDQNDE